MSKDDGKARNEGIKIPEGLRLAVDEFNSITGRDGDLVRAGAIEHGIQVIEERGILRPVTAHAYNARGVHETDLSVISRGGIQTLILACMDYRQVEEVAADLTGQSKVAHGSQLELPSGFALITSAGGAAQVKGSTRLSAHINLLTQIAKVAPETKFVLVGHNDGCGGMKHFEGKPYLEAVAQGLVPDEIYISRHVLMMRDTLVAKKVNPRNITSLVANVANNRYQGLGYATK